MKLSDKKYIAVPHEDQSIYAYDFSEFVHLPTKTDYTFIGIGSGTKIYSLYDKMVLFWTELPNCLALVDDINCDFKKTFESQDKFIKILTNCPFSSEYFNKLHNYDKFQYVDTPFNPSYIPQEEEKIYDVFYTGNLPCPISFALPIMREFKHIIASYSKEGTHKNTTYKQKLQLNAQCKTSIIHNLLAWPHKYRANTDLFEGHKAFELVHSHGIVPQIKTRLFEAAASKSVILCLQDPWNIIEHYFDKDEFIYWTNENDLRDKIQYISNNYDKFIPMVEKAYHKLINNYTIKHFFEKYLVVL